MVKHAPHAPSATHNAFDNASQIIITYYGGPCDGETETRTIAPTDGELVHRLVGQRYVTYRWSQIKFVFLLVG